MGITRVMMVIRTICVRSVQQNLAKKAQGKFGFNKFKIGKIYHVICFFLFANKMFTKNTGCVTKQKKERSVWSCSIQTLPQIFN